MLRIFNEWLRQFPRLRGFLIHLFLYTRYIFISIKNKINGYKTGFLTDGVRLTTFGEHCFFGYYDKSPFNNDGNQFVYHRIKSLSMTVVGDYAEIILKTMDGKEEVIGKTLAWNLQQGSMLQFLNDEVVVWNDFRNDEYCTVFHNVIDGTERVYPVPTYDLHKNTNKALSIDFERLNVDASGYGYIQKQINSFPYHTGITLVDFDKQEDKEIINTKRICEEFLDERFEDAFHYINHVNFNPSGNRFLFLHRFVFHGKRYSRMFTSDLNGKNIHLLAGDEMVSHFTWKNDNQILVWYKNKDQGTHYYLIDDKENEDNLQIIGEKTLLEDGHPTYSADQKTIITDTYPDKACLRHLIVYDVEKDRSRDIARLHAPIRLNGPTRCDLHPRWHPNQYQVCIDSVHENFRGIYLVNCMEEE